MENFFSEVETYHTFPNLKTVTYQVFTDLKPEYFTKVKI